MLHGALGICADGTYEDPQDAGACLACVLPCKFCTNATTCTSCEDPMAQLDTDKCIYCQADEYWDGGACATCHADCNSKCFDSATTCLECVVGGSTEILDPLDYTCKSTCTGVNLLIGDQQICRNSEIYVDPSSPSIVELGTKAYPYKTLHQAFIEVWNFWPDLTTDVFINVLEGSNSTIWYKNRPLLMFQRDNVQVRSYSKSVLPAGTNPARAEIFVTNMEEYRPMVWNTKFTLIGDIDYDMTMASVAVIKVAETKAIGSGWYAMIAIQTAFTLQRVNVKNQLKLDDDDFAIINPVNLGLKTLSIIEAEFIIYGTVMAAFTTLSMHALDVTIDTEKLVGGFVFIVACNPLTDVTTGEVLIDNLRLDGKRVTLFKYGGIYMTGPQNFTITNSYIGSYAFMFDAKQLTRADSPLNCLPDDDVQQNIIMTNTIYNMSTVFTGTPHHGFVVSFLEWYPRTNMNVIFQNNTILNIYRTFYRVLLVDSYHASITCNDNLWKDTTSAVDVTLLKTTKDVTIINNTFEKVSSTSQNLFIIQDAQTVLIDNWFMNGAADDVVSSAIINFNLAELGVAKIKNARFINNQFLGTKAIVSQQLLSYFELKDSIFSGEQLLQNTNYIDIQQVVTLNIFNNEFTNCQYLNPGDSGVYLIYIEKIFPDNSNPSTIRNVTFNNVKTNALSFGGFDTVDGGVSGTANFVVTDISITDCVFESPDSLIQTKKYSYIGDAEFTIINSQFTNLTFEKFGNLIALTHNAKKTINLIDITFTDIFGAGIRLEPQDIFDKTNPLKLSIQNCIFKDNVPFVSGFIDVYENSKVFIDNTEFDNLFSIGSGSVLLANYKENSIEITNSTFRNNYSILGGVFYAQFASAIKCTNCTFFNNIAVRGGVAFLNSNGKLDLINSTITHNLALNAPILYISACNADFSILSQVEITANSLLTMDQLLTRSETNLLHIDDRYIKSIQDNQAFYEKSVTGSKMSMISMIKGKIRIDSGSNIHDQTDFLASFESEIQIHDSNIYDIDLPKDHVIFHLLSSKFTFDNTKVKNINCPTRDESIFQVRLESTFNSKHAVVDNCTCQFTFMLYSTAMLIDLELTDISSTKTIIDSVESEMTIVDSDINNIITDQPQVVRVENSQVFNIFNTRFTQANKDFFNLIGSSGRIENSTITSDFSQPKRGIYMQQSSIEIVNSVFSGFKTDEEGAAVYTYNSNVDINGSIFKNNQAQEGAAFFLDCDTTATCSYNLRNTQFINNTAAYKGGAISLTYYIPELSNNTFTTNTALYGPDVSAYPYRISRKGDLLKNYVSGQKIAQKLEFQLVDVYGKQIQTDSESVLTISAVDQAIAKVIGNTDVAVENGLATFSDITFITNPGQQDVSYSISSSNIDMDKLAFFNETEASVSQTITIDFRKCSRGEEQKNGMCNICPTGKYSLVAGSAECAICPKNSQCAGKDVIRVNKGFWRSSIDSETIHACLYETACLGDDGSTDDIEQPYQCAEGYGGNLCTRCMKIDGTQYQRTGDHKCAQCIDPIINALRLSALAIIMIVFFIAVIWSNMRTKKDSMTSILMRILTNYVQIVTSAASFNLTFPASIQTFFETVKTVGESAKVFLSLDCFIMDFDMVKDNETTEYFKAFITGLMPIGLLIVCLLVWTVLKFILRISWQKWKNNFILSTVVCMFMIHPSLTGMAAGLYNCYALDDGELWLYKELDIRCWDSKHRLWAIGLGGPMMILWVFGLPFLGFLMVRHNKNRLEETDVVFKYRILYQGYRDEAYYWEFVNIFRKVSMVIINIFLAIYPPIYKTFVATLTLAIILRQQEQVKPYKIKIMNECEFRESTTSIITLFGGMFFILEDLPNVVRIILVVAIFGCNAWFYSLWLHLFFRESRFSAMRFFSLFLGKISFLGKEYWEKEIVKSLKTDQGIDILFGKEAHKDMMFSKMDMDKGKNSDGSNIIKSTESNKGSTKGMNPDDQKAVNNVEKKKKKKVKKKKKKLAEQLDQTKEEGQPIDNQYDEDEFELGNQNAKPEDLDGTRDMNRTKDMDQTQDYMRKSKDEKDEKDDKDYHNLEDLDDSQGGREQEEKPRKKKRKKKKKKVKKIASSSENKDYELEDDEAEGV